MCLERICKMKSFDVLLFAQEPIKGRKRKHKRIKLYPLSMKILNINENYLKTYYEYSM